MLAQGPFQGEARGAELRELEEHKKCVCCSLCTKKIVYMDQSHHDRSPNENLSRMQLQIHPIRMGVIRVSKVKQLFLHAKPRRLEFGGSKNLLYSLHRRFVIFLFFTN